MISWFPSPKHFTQTPKSIKLKHESPEKSKIPHPFHEIRHACGSLRGGHRGHLREGCGIAPWVYLGVSQNRGGPPKSSILIGFSLINHPFWGTTIFGNTHLGHPFWIIQNLLTDSFCWWPFECTSQDDITDITILFIPLWFASRCQGPKWLHGLTSDCPESHYDLPKEWQHCTGLKPEKIKQWIRSKDHHKYSMNQTKFPLSSFRKQKTLTRLMLDTFLTQWGWPQAALQ